MKIRGVILATCAMMVFFASYACANQPESEPVSSAKPVMVPYLNKSINEVKNGYAGTSDASVNADSERTRSTEEAAGEDSNEAGTGFGAVLTNAGRMERDENIDMRSDCTEPLPELVGSEPNESAGRSEDSVLTDWVYYGNCRITHYDAGPCCCGEFATGCTASGVLATINHTVASGEDLPFGTEVLINGQIYVVEDRGVDPYQFDIFVSTHDEAVAMGMYYTDVYVR